MRHMIERGVRERCDRIRAQRAGPQHPGTRRGGHLGEHGILLDRLARPYRGYDQRRQLVKPPRQMRKPAQRRPVGPVQIIDDQRNRTLARQLPHQQHQRVAHHQRPVTLHQ